MLLNWKMRSILASIRGERRKRPCWKGSGKLKKVQVKYRIPCYCIVLVFIMGCGLKSNPVSLNANPDYQQTVKNLIAVSADDSITLKWDFYDKSELINNINI